MIITFKKSMKKLFLVWTVISIILLLLFIIQTYFNKYGADKSSAWLWLSINVLTPNLLIFFLLFIYLKKNSTLLNFQLPLLEGIIYVFTILLCFLYLAGILMIPLLAPFIGDGDKTEIEVLQTYDNILHILQALIIALLVLFIYRINKLYAIKDFNSGTTVFISYNHSNSDSALHIRERLKNEDIKVIIDRDNMEAGDMIEDFIKESIEHSDVTFSIVSQLSLISGWVGIETLDTFLKEEKTQQKKFIAGYLDEDFFRMKFTSESIKKINLKLNEIQQEKEERVQLGTKTRDIDDIEERLLFLKENLDLIIQRLRSSLCVDVRPEKLPATFPLILKSIKNI